VRVLETERLVLRRVGAEDAEFVLELLNEPSFVANIGDRNVRTVAEARAYIADRVEGSYARHGFGMYVVEAKDDRAPLGLCGLVKRDSLEDVDVGYAFLPRHWGKGYAVEAASAVLRYARETLAIPRVVAITMPDNESSIRVLERIGLRYDRTIDLPDCGPNKLFVPAE
jgi:[ribosomal protein S5]-alanine N-acetyltransferase